ncbi:hypothetical protein LRS13_11830 [Svornostia abyssi]|uniref:Asl1-like glycosyl hydrolase catalytic domain-containing protein n=1 Tax=Svornostia abyssi TaxID=2898438 RepID=A0ABY5PN74_9ACTN|nr:hypothetical protein LRS13_11830 [Parviterribacteraceae bacterium J379]
MTGRRVLTVLVLVAAVVIPAAVLVVLRGGEDADVTPDQRQAEQADIPFEAGVQAGRIPRDPVIAARLGAPVARVEWDIATPAQELRPIVAAYARRGVRVQPLAGYEGRMPTKAEAENVGAWARVVGPEGGMWRSLDPKLAVQAIEFGNETSFAYQGTQKRGGEYARLARDASRATNAAGVGLFIQADDANQVDGWINQMYDAVPDLHEYAAAWIVHPYGNEWRRRLDWAIARTSENGSPRIPIAITEYGVANDGGRCLDKNYGWPLCLTSAQAADILSGVVRELRADYPRVTQFILYNNHDLRPPGTNADAENYFGARRSDGSSKGAYTRAAEQVMATR